MEYRCKSVIKNKLKFSKLCLFEKFYVLKSLNDPNLLNKKTEFANTSPHQSKLLLLIIKSSHQRSSMKDGALRNFAKLKEKHLCQSLNFNKVAGLRSGTLLKKRNWHRCFPLNFAKILRRKKVVKSFKRNRYREREVKSDLNSGWRLFFFLTYYCAY